MLLRSVVAAGLLIIGGCARPQVGPAPAPVSGDVTADELTVYRTVAESVYVRATEHTVAIASTVMDSICTGTGCVPIADRHDGRRSPPPLVGSTPWPTEAAELRMRDAHSIRLDGVAIGRRRLVVIDPAELPAAAADTSTWRYFRGNYGGIAGVLRFSPVGFDQDRERASVSVLWRCGPACGHVLTVTLRARGAGEWEIADMLLVRPGSSPGRGESDQ